MADEPLDLEFDDELDELDATANLAPDRVAAIVSGTDWTTETLASQLKRGNIALNPRFQRRDAWKVDRKSRFIESLIVGLPIPQLVLAESKTDRGKFIVLDGKQRLLAILQFWGYGNGESNGYALTGLNLRPDLKGVNFTGLSTTAAYEPDYNALCNQPIRTVVIRNWADSSLLHEVFLRLNTGSLMLSPQELRQALLPGAFSDFVDDAAVKSTGLRKLLGVAEPDPRMRDIEILARFLSFRFFATDYPGRMKAFLDGSFLRFNQAWATYESPVKEAVSEFEEGVKELMAVFGTKVARKPSGKQFNRAIFDALIYFHSQPALRKRLQTQRPATRKSYDRLFMLGSPFSKAIESDTAGAPNTATRLAVWAAALTKITGRAVLAPEIPGSDPPDPQPRSRPQGRKRAAPSRG